MGTNKKRLHASAAVGPKERHKRARRPQNGGLPFASVPDGLVAKPALPIPKSKHHSYFEFVENKEKKKKLNFQSTYDKNPPQAFEFVPVGNPELTAACKELSRERNVQIFIVSHSDRPLVHNFANQMHRVGYHFHASIVSQARASIIGAAEQAEKGVAGGPEPIPESQELYHSQVDSVLRDLFPRIPHTDRQLIIQHAFTRGVRFKGEKPVGLNDTVTLARRVQLAVLAHIRHNHTRAVQALCLDILVKWRGDEETGRDQLDEILREVVVISDSEDDESDRESTDGICGPPTSHESGMRATCQVEHSSRGYSSGIQPGSKRPARL
ncbi:hypothetical protein CDD83_6365 [Cordyceps sp. RAO-2017]|nr:hypothetical protein CDD83_6365 [Cordyceps sp. RAO-2017]